MTLLCEFASFALAVNTVTGQPGHRSTVNYTFSYKKNAVKTDLCSYGLSYTVLVHNIISLHAITQLFDSL